MNKEFYSQIEWCIDNNDIHGLTLLRDQVWKSTPHPEILWQDLHANCRRLFLSKTIHENKPECADLLFDMGLECQDQDRYPILVSGGEYRFGDYRNALAMALSLKKFEVASVILKRSESHQNTSLPRGAIFDLIQDLGVNPDLRVAVSEWLVEFMDEPWYDAFKHRFVDGLARCDNQLAQLETIRIERKSLEKNTPQASLITSKGGRL